MAKNKKNGTEKNSKQSKIRVDKGLNLVDIDPKTDSQERLFDEWDSGKNVLAIGSAGTGKTFGAIYLAISDILDKKHEGIIRLVIYRSAVPTRDMGFLKGDMAEKAAAFEEPYRQIIGELFHSATAYESLVTKKVIEFATTSYTRGITQDNCIIIVDEVQNMTDHEISTLITRMGENSRIILCGDSRQVDLNVKKEQSGLANLLRTVEAMPDWFSVIKFTPDDIVRHPMLKEFIVAREKMGI